MDRLHHPLGVPWGQRRGGGRGDLLEVLREGLGGLLPVEPDTDVLGVRQVGRNFRSDWRTWLLTSCCVLIIGWVTWVMLSTLPVTFRHPSESDHFSQLGSYLGGVGGAVFSALNTVILLYLGLYYADKVTDQRERQRQSAELVTLWHSERIFDYRVRVHADGRPADFKLLAGKEAYGILSFFESWATLSKAGLVDRDIMECALGAHAERWWDSMLGPAYKVASNERDLSMLKLIHDEVVCYNKNRGLVKLDSEGRPTKSA